MLDDITYVFQKFYHAANDILERMGNVMPQLTDYFSMLGFMLIHVSKNGPCCNILPKKCMGEFAYNFLIIKP